MDETSSNTDESLQPEILPPVDAERLVLLPSMSVEQIDASVATIYLRSNGARLRIPRPLYDLLLQFETPRSVAAVAGCGPQSVRVAGAIEALRAKGFLAAEGEKVRLSRRRLTTDAPVRLFDSPAQKLVPTTTDVLAIGVPYDLSDRSAAGARNGPASFRDTSLQMLYCIDKRSGRPLGWYDADRDRPILSGVTIGDCGDVFIDHGESQTELFARVREVLMKVAGGGSLPVLIGGDGAISFPAVEFLQRSQSLAMIRIGCSAVHAGSARVPFVTPSTLPERVLSLPGITAYVHLGQCDRPTDGPGGFTAFDAPLLLREGVAVLVPVLGRQRTVYLSLDMSALSLPGDPTDDQFQSTRFTYAQLHAILCGIGDEYQIVGIDLVGLNPSKPGWPVVSMTAVHLLITALSAACNRSTETGDRP